MPYDLQALLNQTAINELQKLGLAGAGTIVTLSMISGMAVSSVLELTDGSDPLARSPQNCTCASQRLAQMHLRDIDANVCFFPIGERQPECHPTCLAGSLGLTFATCPAPTAAAFDWKAAERAYRWSCFAAPTVLYFPLDLLDVPLFQLMGLPPGSDNYTRFQVQASGNLTLYSEVLESFYPACFDGAAQLKGGVFVANHRAYFDICQPQSCSYTITSTPSFLTGLTTALGTISGLQAVFLLLVDRGYDYYRLKCKREQQRKQEAGDTAQDGSDGHVHARLLGSPPTLQQAYDLQQPLVATAAA